MTKTDFAELKEKLCEFDILDSSDDFDEYVKQFPVVANNGYSRGITHSYWQTSARHQHTKSAAIISELIEIIKLQSVTIDSICTTHSDDCADADEEFSEDETCECGYISIINNKKETTTRLQKLRDGIESGK